MKRLARVDVSHASHEALVEQFDFDRLGRALQGRGKILGCEFLSQRLGAKPRKGVCVQGQAAEITCVLEHKDVSAEIKDNGGMLWQHAVSRREINAAGHSKMA